MNIGRRIGGAIAPVVGIVALLACGPAQGEMNPRNLLLDATLSASSTASPKFLPERVVDGMASTRWASRNGAGLPQTFTAQFDRPVHADTLIINPVVQKGRYDAWERVRISLDGKPLDEVTLANDEHQQLLVRFPRQAVRRVEVEILGTHTRATYVGISMMGLYLDPGQRMAAVVTVPRPKPQSQIAILGAREHPTVNVTAEDIERARQNIERFPWARDYWRGVLAEADRWLERPAEEWLTFLPAPGAAFAYGHAGCPICNAKFGYWASARASWDNPGHLTCTNGHMLPDADHPDPGTGYKGDDGRVYYFVGAWNAWVTEQWTTNALPALATAYLISGDERYGALAAALLDGLASIYPECDAGSWDYPSNPPSGRLARPWYQVARTLVIFVDAYDFIHHCSALDEPSHREGFTRRQNIEKNLLENGAYYCYSHSFSGALHNGHADYMRGALAVGCALGIPEYVYHAVEGPYSIHAMIANNADRDGQYYESAQSYGLSARSLYLTFAEPLRRYRDDRYPEGINLYNDARFVSFFEAPTLVMNAAGHVPNLGDSPPGTQQTFAPARLYDSLDHLFAEMVWAGTTDPVIRRRYEALVAYLCGDGVDARRGGVTGRNVAAQRWMLFNAKPLSEDAGELDADMQRRLFGSWNLGQKGLAVLRDGAGEHAQAALLRYGPTLNHGHHDELALTYYAKGWQMTYDLGYSWASTHTQVGWAKQTASHTTVVVNEKSQLEADGSGGSLHLFASVPGLQLVEASAPLAYASENVKEYRRMVALIGEGRDQVLLDVFRVSGGRQHDYIVASQGVEQTISGVSLGDPQPGSLAGVDINWGTIQNNDGDLRGHANKTAWNPPPGNGYGFIHGVRQGSADGTWRGEWALGGRNDARFRVHLLAEQGDQAIIGRAPGIYPHIRPASYAFWRRRSEATEELASTFVSVMEPVARPLQASLIPASDMPPRRVEGDAETEYVPSAGVLLLQGSPGSFVELRFSVPQDGMYIFGVQYRRTSAYGAAEVAINGNAIGDIDGFHPNQTTTGDAEFSPVPLSAGEHRVRMTLLAPGDRGAGLMLGLSSFSLRRAAEPVSGDIHRVLAQVERLPVRAGGQVTLAPAAVRLMRHSGLVQIAVSSAVENGAVVVDTEFGPIELDGAFVLLTGRDATLLNVAGCAVRELKIAGRSIELPATLHEGTVAKVDLVHSLVEVEGMATDMPADAVASMMMVMFDRPQYTRNTSYHLSALRATGATVQLDLGGRPLVLGYGQVTARPDANRIVTDIPHEYGRQRGDAPNSRFFEGKQLLAIGKEAATRVTAMLPGQPTQLLVESNELFKVNDRFRYIDVQPGDHVRVISGFHINIEP